MVHCDDPLTVAPSAGGSHWTLTCVGVVLVSSGLVRVFVEWSQASVPGPFASSMLGLALLLALPLLSFHFRNYWITKFLGSDQSDQSQLY